MLSFTLTDPAAPTLAYAIAKLKRRAFQGIFHQICGGVSDRKVSDHDGHTWETLHRVTPMRTVQCYCTVRKYVLYCTYVRTVLYVYVNQIDCTNHRVNNTRSVYIQSIRLTREQKESNPDSVERDGWPSVRMDVSFFWNNRKFPLITAIFGPFW